MGAEKKLNGPAPFRLRKQVERKVRAYEKHDQLSNDVLANAECHCASQNERLTPIRRDLLKVLSEAEAPLGAYDITERLGELRRRKIAPIAAYRGLDFLSRVGLVTRLESRKAFILCTHPDHSHASVFFLCSACGEVMEVPNEQLRILLDQSAKNASFMTERRVIEIHGTCKPCQMKKAAAIETER